MRKLIVWELITLDGYFEGTLGGDLAFHQIVWGPELEALSNEQLGSVGTLLFGRVTYQGMASFWPSQKGEIADFMNSVPKVVFSRTLEKVEWINSRLSRDNPETEVARLKQAPGKDLFIFGSADLVSTLEKHGLIDEYRLLLAPVVLGEGNPLFKPRPKLMKTTLLEARPLKSGSIVLRYEPERTVPRRES